MTSTYHFTLLRHAQSEGNVDKLFQGQLDFSLTDLGRSQAGALAEQWQQEGVDFERVISSPLARAFETAAIIAAKLSRPIEAEPLWMEQDFGALSSLSIPEYTNGAQKPPFFNVYAAAGETGESRLELFARSAQAVQSLFRHPPGSYLVVSHGAILNTALYVILGIALHADREGPRFLFKNTTYATLRYEADRHQWLLTGLNDPLHLHEPTSAG